MAELLAAKNNLAGLQMCTRTVMDTSDPDIVFDSDGICNWWHEFRAFEKESVGQDREAVLEAKISAIKESGRNKNYDCLLGLSGGVDSCYMAYLAKKCGLRPLVVHFDNGWNDELAVHNIERTLKHVGFTLETFVMNWPEFRDLQRSYFKASVIDLDVPTDHMIFGALHQVALKHGIKYILSGNNRATEWLLPRSWYYSKFDLRNLENIHRKFGDLPLKNLPRLGAFQLNYYRSFKGISDVKILELIPYKKTEAKQFLEEEMNWKDYGGKHYESVFTRFYQGYLLPEKYGIDKRKAHLSNLICNGEISREEALAELRKPTDDVERQKLDIGYVAKKLGWSEGEFQEIISLPPVDHEVYGTDARDVAIIRRNINACRRIARSLGPIGRGLRRVYKVFEV